MTAECADSVSFDMTQDTDDMDYLLPQSITELGNCLMQLAATLIFVSIVQPIFLAGQSLSILTSTMFVSWLLALQSLRLPCSCTEVYTTFVWLLASFT